MKFGHGSRPAACSSFLAAHAVRLEILTEISQLGFLSDFLPILRLTPTRVGRNPVSRFPFSVLSAVSPSKRQKYSKKFFRCPFFEILIPLNSDTYIPQSLTEIHLFTLKFIATPYLIPSGSALSKSSSNFFKKFSFSRPETKKRINPRCSPFHFPSVYWPNLCFFLSAALLRRFQHFADNKHMLYPSQIHSFVSFQMLLLFPLLLLPAATHALVDCFSGFVGRMQVRFERLW